MRFWAVLWVLIAIAIGAFTLMNWTVLSTRTLIEMGVAQLTAPLGLALLAAMAALALLFALFIVWLETTTLRHLRRASRDVKNEPVTAVADGLRVDLERHVAALRGETSEALRAILARLDRVEQVVRDEAGRPAPSIASRADTDPAH